MVKLYEHTSMWATSHRKVCVRTIIDLTLPKEHVPYKIKNV